MISLSEFEDPKHPQILNIDNYYVFQLIMYLV